MSGVALAVTLQPDERFLDLTEPLLERVDLVELAPETLWRGSTGDDAAPRWEPNGFHGRIHELVQRHDLGCIAHGVGLSVGGLASGPARRRSWARAIAATQAAFGFRWYSDHLGVSCPAGEELTLPLPVPFDRAHEQAVVAGLTDLGRLVPVVGLENTVTYFALDEPLAEPAFLERVLERVDGRLVLDLHNLFTAAGHEGYDPADWLDRAPLERVVELHVSGGSPSPPGWLASGASLRLDSHDDAVPEEVFALVEAVLPRCPHLAAVTLERMEGTVAEDDVPGLAGELDRLDDLLGRRRSSAGGRRQGSRAAGAADRAGAASVGRRAVADGPVDPAAAGRADPSPVDPAAAGRADPSPVDQAVSDRADPSSVDPADSVAAHADRESSPAEHVAGVPVSDPLEALLCDLLRDDDPGAALQRRLDDARLAPDLRAALEHVRPDGLRIAALLVARLRFERLVQGAPSGAALFTDDPAGFAERFRGYHGAVVPRSLSPADEWRAFRAWCAGDGAGTAGGS